MVKAYLKFVQEGVFGLISTTNSLLDNSGKLAITGCGERISIWDLRRQVLIKSLHEEDITAEVSLVALSRDGLLLAAGYSDGTIRIWSMSDYSQLSVFNGHRGAITCLYFNSLGSILVSGSKDTEIIVWDIITESGLYRLRGHRDQVTGCRLLEKSNHLVTSSKDGLIKIWETETQHCIQTIVGHRNPVWGIDVNADETRLASCTSDNQIRFWRLHHNEEPREGREYKVNTPINAGIIIHDDADTPKTQAQLDQEKLEQDLELRNEQEFAKYYGSVAIKGESILGLKFDPTNKILAIQTSGKFVDLFKITNYDIIQAKQVSVTDEFRHRQTIKTSSKVRSFAFGNDHLCWNKFIITLAGNSLEAYHVQGEDGFEPFSTMDQFGHRADVRSMALTSNDSMLVSTSSEAVKVWNVKTLNCIRSIPCDYGLCCLFVPGNLHIIVGTKTGSLEIFELASANHIATIRAHEGSVWAMSLSPDQRGIVTGGADKQVKFWDFELNPDPENQKQKKLSLSLAQTLKLEADVLALKFSADKRVLAVSLLDNTVKIFYADTLKFHLSLYGHKLPVMTLDISDDGALIITGSADKNIKIWGLDYGDCHKSFFAHDDSIMQLAFIPNTHHFISTSKDKRIKYWDADKFEHIQTLEFHHGEVWALAMGSIGDFFITGSHDRSMRVFKQTETPLFIESERQQEMEKTWEATLEDDTRVRTKEMLEENLSANKQTLDTIMAGEDIYDAIQLSNIEKLKLLEYEREMDEYNKKASTTNKKKKQDEDEQPQEVPLFTPNMMLLGKSHSDYLWMKINRVRPSDLEESLTLLPFSVMRILFEYFNEWIEDSTKSIEFIFKCSFFLIQVHQNQLSVTSDFIPILQRLNQGLKDRLERERQNIGFNRSAMGYIKREIEINQNYKFFNPDTIKQETYNQETLSDKVQSSSKKSKKKINNSNKK
ncbi:hypothetical protein CYY_008290 [Polysphondylium violaceum]|uniref:Small-subunit processome Utp12 domain-containing protein n=1 Tax=Polysphondylium violaceum TaxID=133409 RepID=A0A8J4PVH2_9MYCE|nr:hypothetical protein CYY_008290 [Polysphondylium violaceum]